MYLLSDGERVGVDLLPSDTPVSFKFKIEPNVTCSWKRENLLVGLSATHLGLSEEDYRLLLFDVAAEIVGTKSSDSPHASANRRRI